MPTYSLLLPVRNLVLTSPAYDLEQVRDQFKVVENGYVFVNHAGMSPLPNSVSAAMKSAISAISHSGSEAYTTVMEPIFEELPVKAAQFINASPAEIAFPPNTSTGINMIAQSIPLAAGDNVLLCDVEFPSNVYPWMNLQSKGVETRLVPAIDGGVSLESFARYRDQNTKVVAVSAVQFFSGRREDLLSLGSYCAEHGLWLVVDAIQAAGIIPIDVKAMKISALVTGGQKALLASPGQGFMFIQEQLIEQMRPVFVGAASVENFEHWLDYDLTSAPGAARFMLGTPNIVGLAGLNAALSFLMDIGVHHIAEWVSHLTTMTINDLTERGFNVITPSDPRFHANIVTWAWNQEDVNDAVKVLRRNNIILREHHDKEGKPYLRLSTHCYNTEEDVLRVGEALEEATHEQR